MRPSVSIPDSQGRGNALKWLFMQQEFLSIDQVAEYLGVKPCTIYAWAQARKIPCYKFGRLVRFKWDEIELWVREQKQDWISPGKTAKKVLKNIGRKKMNVGEIIRKSIDNVKQEKYNISIGKPDQVKGLGKGVKNGTL
jgi:excisionase family DNA binding protein